jgi:HAAS
MRSTRSSFPRRRCLAISHDPRKDFVSAVRAELPRRPLSRRRLLSELTDHLDDAVADLRANGLSERAATDEALERVGDPEAIGTAFRNLRPKRRLKPRLTGLRSPAWLAVVVMSLVTALAAELPQVSGAKASARPPAPTRSQLPAHALKPEPRPRSRLVHRAHPRGRG